MDGPPPSQASSDTNSYYYLANIVVEQRKCFKVLHNGSEMELVAGAG